MSGRVVSFSIKPHDARASRLIEETKKVVEEQALPSFSYIMIQALRAYMEKHHDLKN